MQWHEIRERHPSRWLLVEAIAAHSVEGQRVLDDLAVLATYPDGTAAMNGYREIHRREPQRELYVLHTDRETLDVTEVHSGKLIRNQLEKARASDEAKGFMRLVGTVDGPKDLSRRKGFSGS